MDDLYLLNLLSIASNFFHPRSKIDTNDRPEDYFRSSAVQNRFRIEILSKTGSN